jgi:hypothetical protein
MSDAIINQPPNQPTKRARVLRFEDYLQRQSTSQVERQDATESPFGRPAGASLLNVRQLAHRRVMLRYMQERRGL